MTDTAEPAVAPAVAELIQSAAELVSRWEKERADLFANYYGIGPDEEPADYSKLDEAKGYHEQEAWDLVTALADHAPDQPQQEEREDRR